MPHPGPDQDTQLLLEFLRTTRLSLLNRFAALSHNSITRGKQSQQFVFIPGTRTDRVLLVAHADTYWEHEGIQKLHPRVSGAWIHSTRNGQGIGADDRAGCALLWTLRHLGHSILVTSGEEIGCVASRWLMEAEENSDLRETLNKSHQFAVQFDLRGTGEFKCYDVGSGPFREYCAQKTGFTDAGARSSTDIRHLCSEICGVNLCAGYYDEHTEAERLCIPQWAAVRNLALEWLASPGLPHFPRLDPPRPDPFALSHPSS